VKTRAPLHLPLACAASPSSRSNFIRGRAEWTYRETTPLYHQAAAPASGLDDRTRFGRHGAAALTITRRRQEVARRRLRATNMTRHGEDVRSETNVGGQDRRKPSKPARSRFASERAGIAEGKAVLRRSWEFWRNMSVAPILDGAFFTIAESVEDNGATPMGPGHWRSLPHGRLRRPCPARRLIARAFEEHG